MGYYTSHSLSIVNPPPDGRDLIFEFWEENEDARYALNRDGSTCEACKWYDHQEDMRAFSKKFPAIIFLLEGIGEEQPDMWKEYYKGGKMQRCVGEVTYPPYDPKQLH